MRRRGSAASDAKAAGRISTVRLFSERLAAATTTKVKAATIYTNVISIKAAENSGLRSHTAPATVTPRKVREIAASILSFVFAIATTSRRATVVISHSIATYQ
jgi:hypothetical protein